MEYFIWLGIVICALKAAIFSGLNLAYFSVSYLRLTVLSKKKDKAALKVMGLRKNPNLLLATILWANVSYNVLLTLLTNSVMAGVTSFLFSTIVLTLVGEILPQSVFSRKAIKFGAFFTPMIRFYQIILYPVTKPTAMALNYFLGKEMPQQYYSEADLISLIEAHYGTDNQAMDISRDEGLGAIHFLELDDRFVKDVGTKILAGQTLAVEFKGKHLKKRYYDHLNPCPFIKKLIKIKHSEVTLTDLNKNPRLVLNVDAFLRYLFTSSKKIDIEDFCEIPFVVTDPKVIVSDILKHFRSQRSEALDHIHIIYWRGRTRKIIQAEELIYLLMKEV